MLCFSTCDSRAPIVARLDLTTAGSLLKELKANSNFSKPSSSPLPPGPFGFRFHVMCFWQFSDNWRAGGLRALLHMGCRYRARLWLLHWCCYPAPLPRKQVFRVLTSHSASGIGIARTAAFGVAAANISISKICRAVCANSIGTNSHVVVILSNNRNATYGK